MNSGVISRTLGLLAVSHVGSTARRVTVPAVVTLGRIAPYTLSGLYSSELHMTTKMSLLKIDVHLTDRTSRY